MVFRSRYRDRTWAFPETAKWLSEFFSLAKSFAFYSWNLPPPQLSPPAKPVRHFLFIPWCKIPALGSQQLLLPEAAHTILVDIKVIQKKTQILDILSCFPLRGGITRPLCPLLPGLSPGTQLCVLKTPKYWKILFGANFYSNILGIITWQQQQKSTGASGLSVSTSLLKHGQACTSQMKSAWPAISPPTPQESWHLQQALHHSWRLG